VPDAGPEVLEALVEEILSGGYLPLEVGSDILFVLQEQVGDLHMMMCSGILDKCVEPLPKGLSLWLQRHGGEEAAAPTRGCSG
jgi:hypothetical protein